MLSPLDATRRSLYGVQVVVSTTLHSAIIVGDWSGSARLYRTGQAMLSLHDSQPRDVGGTTYADYQLNQVVARCELRAEAAIVRPAGFIAVGTGS